MTTGAITTGAMTTGNVADRIEALDWPAIENSIKERGYARIRSLLTAGQCASLVALYDDDSLYRSRIDMARHAFGQGDYAYFAEPLPALVAALREALYGKLAPLANRMMAELGSALRYPETLAAFRQTCHAAGQTRPTPLLLHYRAGGYNNLHRDLYGELLFPLQATAMLSRRAVDYEGGEFLLVENRPRHQARGEAIAGEQGDLLIFPVFERPVQGKRGTLKAAMRHGVSRLHRGERYALGIIFHDAA